MFPHPLSLSSGISTQRNPAGASPGGLLAGLVQSFFGVGVSSVPMACSTPTPAIAQRPQKTNGSTVIGFPLLAVSDVLAAEYAEAKFCPPGGRESGASVVTAPAPVIHRRGTRSVTARNRLPWLQIQLFLEDLPKRPGSAA